MTLFASHPLYFYVLLFKHCDQTVGTQFSKLWDGPKDDKKSVKLKVEFTYPATSSASSAAAGSGMNSEPSSASRRAPTVSENVEAVRSRLTNDTPFTRAGDDATASATSPEAIFGELQGLRKKYDAVVEYTVHLTAERDAIVAQLETSQRELTKEKAKKRGDSMGGGGGASAGKGDKNGEKKVVEKVSCVVFNLVYIVFCFLCM